MLFGLLNFPFRSVNPLYSLSPFLPLLSHTDIRHAHKEFFFFFLELNIVMCFMYNSSIVLIMLYYNFFLIRTVRYLSLRGLCTTQSDTYIAMRKLDNCLTNFLPETLSHIIIICYYFAKFKSEENNIDIMSFHIFLV